MVVRLEEKQFTRVWKEKLRNYVLYFLPILLQRDQIELKVDAQLCEKNNKKLTIIPNSKNIFVSAFLYRDLCFYICINTVAIWKTEATLWRYLIKIIIT